MNPLIKQIAEFVEYQENENTLLRSLLGDLLERIESEEGDIERFVDLDTLKMDLKEIKLNECHGEDKLLRQTAESVRWLKKARKFFTAGVKLIKDRLQQYHCYDPKPVIKIRNKILALDDRSFFRVYQGSTWL